MKIKTALLVLLMIVFVNNVLISQTTFQETISGSTNSSGTSVVQTNDGGYVIAGNIKSIGVDSNDIFLTKTSSIGSILWTKTYGGAGNEEASNVEKTADGGFIISGNTNSFGAGGYDIYVIKTDSLGDTLWTKTYGGVNDESNLSRDIDSLYDLYFYQNYLQQTSDGGYVISSTTKSFGQGNRDIYLIKLTATGDTLWTKTYGNSDSDIGTCVKQTIDGGYIIAGCTFSNDSTLQTPQYAEDLIKTDANGNISWSKEVASADGFHSYGGNSIYETSSGGYIIFGEVYDYISGPGVISYMLKTDNNGNSLWGNSFPHNGYIMEHCGIGAATSDGGFLITGYEWHDDSIGQWLIGNGILFKIDSTGNQVWRKSYGTYENSEQIYQLKLTDDGGFILIGDNYLSPQPYLNGNTYLIKTDSTGDSGCNKVPDNTLGTYNFPNINLIPNIIQGSGCIVHSPPTQISNPGLTANNYCLSVGINEITKENEITIAPNPFTSHTTITFSKEQKNTTLIITDVLGNNILQSTINTKQSTIDMSGVAKGIYFVEITDSDKNNFYKKVIKQ